MDSKEIQILVEKFIENTASPAEEARLMDWYRSANEQELEWLSENTDESELTRLQMLAAINHEIGHTPIRRMTPFRWVAAASILFMLSFGGYLLLHQQKPQQTAQNDSHDIAPGTNHAILKIGHGKSVVLDSSGKDLIAQQGGTTIHKTADGSVAYTDASTYVETPVYDTLIVPAGSKPYRLALADGSKVLVNAASRISYPENFGKKERQIDLIDGEAYFEVVHDAARPLRIAVKGQVIEDIGTQFNINAFHDEPAVITTLVEGSVRVIKGTDSKTLLPGQQALVKNIANKISVSPADVDEAIAWKDGMFRYSSVSLESIMRQVSRWYGVQVVFQDESLKRKHFSAVSTRFGMISKLLHNLELTGEVRFKVENNKITVLNK